MRDRTFFITDRPLPYTGGGIFTAPSSFLEVRQESIVTGNQAGESGGGIFVDGSATLVVSPDSKVKKNIPNNFN